ncbi:MAG TPA: ABC transporter permease [Gemmatimonadaceae bacterium]|nr:ABC transporter permease [Gemmatimonadaceae bacterium]
MLALTTAVAAGTALLFGIAPALRAARVAPLEALNEQGRGTSSGRRVGLSGSLVMAQVALSLVLLVGAGLFVRTFASLATIDLGFERDRALLVHIGAPGAGVDPAERGPMYERILEAVRGVPGVSRAALSMITPMSGSLSRRRMEFPGRPELPERERSVPMNVVSPGWFAALGTPLVAGRDFEERDRVGAPRTVIVNRAFAAKYFGERGPIGHLITESPEPGADPAPLEIVGVVEDAVYRSLRDPMPPTMYWPLAQQSRPPGGLSLVVRAAAGPPTSLTQERLVASLSGFFGALALLLAALGLHGITAYTVRRRHIELGIRMALGTTPAGVVRLVLSRVALLVGGGVLIDTVASWWASTFIEALLFALAPRDPVTIVGAVAVLAAVGALAGWLPARRAARIDPACVLRAG